MTRAVFLIIVCEFFYESFKLTDQTKVPKIGDRAKLKLYGFNNQLISIGNPHTHKRLVITWVIAFLPCKIASPTIWSPLACVNKETYTYSNRAVESR